METLLILLLLLIAVPLVAAVLLRFTRRDAIRSLIIGGTAIVLLVASILLTKEFFYKPKGEYLTRADTFNYVMIGIEVLIAIYLTIVSIKNHKPLAAFLVLLQTGALCWFELGGSHQSHQLRHHLYVDKLSVLLVLIITVIGCLICLFAVPYMRKYHEHHKEIKDRRPTFFSILFVFLSAMYGIVLSNDLIWIYFFWELTTLCSFLLIGYSKEKQSKQNSFTALVLNALGGVCFVAAILYLGFSVGIMEMHDLWFIKDKSVLIIPVSLLAIAGLTKSAQFPFSKWLLGAMVAPTPVSALLHSSTMVKAGVYLILRLSPLLVGNLAGTMVILIGGLSFLAASMLAVSQSDAKRVLAYSTIANLGLIVACAGVGSYQALWAATMLILFHAIAKSLLFLAVGATEHALGSRDLEDMHGLIVKLPFMALVMAIGIAGMFLAPFGMLISKWAALKAFMDSPEHLLFVLVLAFGSAATLLYWTKWLGKIVAVLQRKERLQHAVAPMEGFVLGAIAVLTLAVCVAFQSVSQYLVVPFLHEITGQTMPPIISSGNRTIMLMMLIMIAFLPIGLRLFASTNTKVTTVYMSGANVGDNRFFVDSFRQQKHIFLSNWYMEKYFGEKRLLNLSIWVGATLLVLMAVFIIGRVL